MSRNVRSRQRRGFDLRRITLGDYVVLASALLALVSLFLPWFVNNTAVPATSQWAFTYSEAASVIVIVFFLATLFLVLYPVLANQFNLAPLPFATPLVFIGMGVLLLLIFDYELGKYSGFSTGGTSRGFGIWLGLFASLAYIVGAVIRWGSRTTPRAGLEI